jgi:hypothetical protein
LVPFVPIANPGRISPARGNNPGALVKGQSFYKSVLGFEVKVAETIAQPLAFISSVHDPGDFQRISSRPATLDGHCAFSDDCYSYTYVPFMGIEVIL